MLHMKVNEEKKLHIMTLWTKRLKAFMYNFVRLSHNLKNQLKGFCFNQIFKTSFKNILNLFGYFKKKTLFFFSLCIIDFKEVVISV